MSFELLWGFSRSFCRWVIATAENDALYGKLHFIRTKGKSLLAARHRGWSSLQKFVKLSPCVTEACTVSSLSSFIKLGRKRLASLTRSDMLDFSYPCRPNWLDFTLHTDTLLEFCIYLYKRFRYHPFLRLEIPLLSLLGKKPQGYYDFYLTSLSVAWKIE